MDTIGRALTILIDAHVHTDALEHWCSDACVCSY